VKCSPIEIKGSKFSEASPPVAGKLCVRCLLWNHVILKKPLDYAEQIMYIQCIDIVSTLLQDTNMRKDTVIQARVDSRTKEKARTILAGLDVSLSEAIGMFLRQVVYQRSIPFKVELPSRQTARAIAELESGKGRKSRTTKELFEDLGR
jgi:DNA-damage-inducible protein J